MRRHAKAIVAAISVLLLTLALSATLATAVAPVVTIEDADNVSYRTADIEGTVNPEGQLTTWRFQYITDAQFQENLTNSLPGFEGAGTPFEGSTETEETLERQFGGFQSGTTYHLRLVAENADGQSEAVAASTFTTKAVGPPSVTIDPVTTFTGTTAKFSGTIDPEAPEESPGEFPEVFDVEWHFECTPACSGGLSGEIDADSDLHTVEADAAGLDPNTNYEVTLVAANAAGPVNAGPESFQTEAVAPAVETLPPAVITDTSAWIGGKVNPRNTATTYYIEYSTDPGFAGSTKVPASEDGEVGADNQFHLVNHHAQGLSPATTYYYRVVAAGAEAEIGGVETVETLANQPPPEPTGLTEGRVYEKVSPADKNGAEIHGGNSEFNVAQAASDGDSIAFGSGSLGYAGDSGSLFPQYLAKRGPSGWSNEGISPRMDIFAGTALSSGYSWFSEDLSKAISTTPAALNPGDVAQTFNMYLRNNSTGAYTTIASPDTEPGGAGYQDSATVPGAVAGDGKYIAYVYEEPDGVDSLAWEWADGENRLVGVLPDGSPVGSSIGGQGWTASYVPGENAISADGSRVFFKSEVYPNNLYVRDFSGTPTTTLVSEPKISTADDTTEPTFLMASPDGRRALFYAFQPLTEDSNPSETELYMWDADKPQGERLTLLTPGEATGAPVGHANGFQGVAAADENMTAIYFATDEVLTPDAVPGGANLYRRDADGAVKLVAPLSKTNVNQSIWGGFMGFEGPEGNEWGRGTHKQSRVTPDGRFLSFVSTDSLTAYDTNGTPQMYLYDDHTEDIRCITCSPIESKSHGGAWFSSGAHSAGGGEACCSPHPLGYLTRSLSPDGSRMVFDTNEPLVRRDSNGKIDVYQWKEGQLTLISTGSGATHSRLLDLSVDGKDIFFTTTQQLVPSDNDGARDLYDARVGGIPELVPSSPCVADECQGTPRAAPAFQAPSSSGFQAGSPGLKSRKCGKGKVRRGGKCQSRRRAHNKRKSKGHARKTGNGQGRNG